ncbi:hypothetical protein OPV22_014835 [Ensete ventricosum]|uniref:Uncharacterized protein n=1 Tax=Ensete ventricosum TaxID=4639 RepID=A0AAV8PR52_ENSVE|nr:hypothetical protein OPV22_014835 [Ensete ventricosum]
MRRRMQQFSLEAGEEFKLHEQWVRESIIHRMCQPLKRLLTRNKIYAQVAAACLKNSKVYHSTCHLISA